MTDPHGSKQPQLKQPIVAVRLDPAVMDRLDDLVQRTGRKRSYYIREAIIRMLPYLEAKYWAHQIERDRDTEDLEFARLIKSLNDPTTKETAGQEEES